MSLPIPYLDKGEGFSREASNLLELKIRNAHRNYNKASIIRNVQAYTEENSIKPTAWDGILKSYERASSSSCRRHANWHHNTEVYNSKKLYGNFPYYGRLEKWPSSKGKIVLPYRGLQEVSEPIICGPQSIIMLPVNLTVVFQAEVAEVHLRAEEIKQTKKSVL